MTGQPPEAIAALHNIIGPHGLLDVSYRAALANHKAGKPSSWDAVMRQLRTAYEITSGLDAGHTVKPVSSDLVAAPCTWCEKPTAQRIYGQPGHYSCWSLAGHPVAQAETEAETSEVSHTADDEALDTTGFQRREKSRGSRRFTVDPAEELHDFTHSVRRYDKTTTEDECAAALDAWHRHFHVGDRPLSFVSSDAYTGITLYELLAAKNGSMVQPEPLKSEIVQQITKSPLMHNSWSFLDPAAVPAVGQGVTELDITGQYLAAASSVDCGDGEPDVLDSVAPDKIAELLKLPGYIELAKTPDLTALPAHVRYSFSELKAGSWLPIPSAKYLIKDHGAALDIARAVIWPGKQGSTPARYGRRLGVWAKEVRAARTALTLAAEAGEPGAALALGRLKGMYAAFLGGGLRSEAHNDRGTLRWDWSDMLRATAGVNALRALDKSEILPFGGMKDSFWFLSDADQTPLRPAGLGYADQPGDHQHQPGKWHLSRWGTVTDDLVRQHAQGRVGLVRKAITTADNERRK